MENKNILIDSMEVHYKKLCVILFGIIFISTSIIIPLIHVLFSIECKPSSITFTPNYLKSFPNHTAWLLVDISIPDKRLQDNFSLDIKTNLSISLETKFWDNEPYEKVIEIFFFPNSTHLNQDIQVEMILNNSKELIKNSALIEIIDWFERNISEILPMKDAFISFLSSNKPVFEINDSTIWLTFDNAPQILIVEHYLFRSDFWELELSRHVMIAPHDWVKAYLRPRNQIKPIWAGEISSWSSENHTVIESDVPPTIFR